MEYFAFTQGVAGKRRLVPTDESISDLIGDRSREFYKSIFIYTDTHQKRLQETGSLAGIRDVTTNRLVWDFDHSEDIECARKDADELCARLTRYGFPLDTIQIAFSGNKGFHVEVETTDRFTVEEFKNINRTLAEGLQTNDTKILDPQRLFRILGTKNDKSGLYKIPLSMTQLSELPIPQIRALAQSLDNIEKLPYERAAVPGSIQAIKITAPQAQPTTPFIQDASELDFKSKPRGFSNCKFAIMNGFFPAGERNHSMMALAATCKAQGYPEEITYNICKAAIRLQATRSGQEPWSKRELWNNVIRSVYGPSWNGAQFSCKNQDFLKGLCQSLGVNKCRHEAEGPALLSVTDMGSDFEKYSLDIEKNTVKTGIPALDENVHLTIGMPVGLLGAPSSGKTSLALNILNNTSKIGIHSAFFSMDMYGPLVFLKQVQKLTGLPPSAVHRLWKEDPKRRAEIEEMVRQEYANVRFSLKSGLSVHDMREMITEQQDRTGEKVKLVLIDYLECISGPYSDATANTAKIAGELKDFATEMGTCVVTLVQPPKSAGDASAALESMRNIKGSSMLEQSFRVILGIYRDGFGPKTPGDDRFMTINALKNTMGGLFSVDLAWNGARGEIHELDDAGHSELEQLRKRKAQAKKAEGSDDIWQGR